jgi:hypothetical protein
MKNQNINCTFFEIIMSRQQWESFKKKVDKEFKYDDKTYFSEMRFFFNNDNIEFEGHSLEE